MSTKVEKKREEDFQNVQTWDYVNNKDELTDMSHHEDR
jgi:hypothetical protein